MFLSEFKYCHFVLEFCLCVSLIGTINGVHVKGDWNTQDFFLFLSKFGVQKTDSQHPDESSGFIYGNVSSSETFSVPITLALLDREYFLEYYGNRTVADKEQACKLMFHKVNQTAFDKVCNKRGADYLRRVPCPAGQLCIDEDPSSYVVKDSQLTFKISRQQQPRFWYVSLVACYFNRTSCTWHHFKENKKLHYDLWLVNGNPNNTAYSLFFTYQFSFERQNTVELYLLFFVIYSLLLPLQLYAVSRQKHPVTRLFTVSLLMEVVGLSLNLLDALRYSSNGEGFPPLLILGDTLDILSRTTFMLLLLLLAKGWAVTRIELTWKPVVFFIWVLYGVVHILLYVWNKTEVDIIEDIDEYQTWPGWFILVLRCAIIVWFLMELKTTMLYEHNTAKLQFFLHFGASALVWFIYLPIVAVIALQIPALWRFKLLLGITYSADCLAYCIMTHLLWPARSEQYFLLANPIDPGDELDEFNEAPHIINHYSSSQPLEFNKITA
ncbi:unnamed protein product [Bemisia tabaci]|uniref:GPR180/TMEM145 transmembrane domain-containing protein n=1 Tax=Bemisia tabaci TaxID=7038 RepID=A0A9P0AD44_BEMTA|nr:unnamed protein product [Bemisia tabaci]